MADPIERMPNNVLPPTGPIERMPNVPLPRKWCPELPRIHSNAVFPYQPNEIAISRTEGGHLAPDVVLIPNAASPDPTIGDPICQYLVIRDFGVDWRHVKSATRNEPLLLAQLQRFEADKSLQFSIVGYSDCAGEERNNIFLRRGRATNVFHLLGHSARSRVFKVQAAPPHEYLTDNSTVAARAENRSVVIEIFADASGIGTL
jgi:hypothetical protein